MVEHPTHNHKAGVQMPPLAPGEIIWGEGGGE